MENEIWKPVIGYEDYYEVSSFGRVKSLERMVISGSNYRNISIKPEKIKKLRASKKQYQRTFLSVDGVNNMVLVHRLVAKAFIPNPENKPCVNHKNGNKSDNSVDNLEWCTYSENTIHGWNTGLINNKHLLKNGSVANRNKKPVVCFNKNNKPLKVFESVTDASFFAGVTKGTLVWHLKGHQKTCSNYIFKYL